MATVDVYKKVLGLKPYLLIEGTEDEDGQFHFSVEAGGSQVKMFETQAELVEVLREFADMFEIADVDGIK